MPRRAGFLSLILACSCFAAVTRVEIVDRSEVLGGASFGTAGPYERITGKLFFAVDPKLAPNRIIADIDLAPRNAQGKVEFSSDFYMLKPRDPAKGNGTALVEISNRGRKDLLNTFDLAAASLDPRTQSDFGDNFLLNRGFTLVWVGWEFDVAPDTGLLRLNAPIATSHGQPISGLVRSEWEGDERVTIIPLEDRNLASYALADPNDPANKLYVRDTLLGERHLIPRDKWTFSDASHVKMDTGFEPGKIYEVVYKAKDPVLAGLGPAAVRDTVSFLKYGGSPEIPLNDQHNYLKRTLAFGASQSGRFLRTFLYDGFNEDEQSRRVFDGVWAHIAGAGRGSFNARFGQPSRDGHPFLNILYPVDMPPFTDAEGVLLKAQQAHVVSKIFYSNGSYEYWSRAASLIHTTPDGKQDQPPAKTTRIYFFAGSQHSAATLPPRKVDARNLAGTNDYRTAMRALLIAMQAWLKDDKEPPASEYPQIAKDQLVSLNAFAFPRITNVELPRRKREVYRLDFSAEPPRTGEHFPSLVPQVDLDGNETSGIRMPEIQVPLASYTGWNLRSPRIGAPDELYSRTGSWIPFALNKTERENRHDPRLSLEERYPGKLDYLEKIAAAAHKLVADGFLLDEDVPKIRDLAASEWDYVLRSN